MRKPKPEWVCLGAIIFVLTLATMTTNGIDVAGHPARANTRGLLDMPTKLIPQDYIPPKTYIPPAGHPSAVLDRFGPLVNNHGRISVAFKNLSNTPTHLVKARIQDVAQLVQSPDVVTVPSIPAWGFHVASFALIPWSDGRARRRSDAMQNATIIVWTSDVVPPFDYKWHDPPVYEGGIFGGGEKFSFRMLHTEWPAATPQLRRGAFADRPVAIDNRPLGVRPRGGFTNPPAAVDNQPLGLRPKVPDPPAPSLTFDAGCEMHDNSIAVGHHHILIVGWDKLLFFDKNGNATAPSPQIPQQLNLAEFFSDFLRPTNPDGTINRSCVNRYLKQTTAEGLRPCSPPSWRSDAGDMPCAKQPNGDKTVFERFYACDPYGDIHLQHACISNFQDARVSYDSMHHRFFVFSNVQQARANYDFIDYDDKHPNFDKVNREYLAFAISKTDDPADGFNQYLLGHSAFGDWPLLGFSEHFVSITFRYPGSLVYLVSMKDVLAGVPNPRTWIYPAEAFPGSSYVAPVAAPEPANGYTFLVGAPSNPMHVYAIPQPGNFAKMPPVLKVEIKLDLGKLDAQRAAAILRGGSLHFVSLTDDWIMRYTRIPVWFPWQTSVVSGSSLNGFMDKMLNPDAPKLRKGAPNGWMSSPIIAVNKHLDLVAGFLRTGPDGKPPVPEARYIVLYGGENEPRRSGLLRAGVSLAADPQVDFQGAAVDPDDDRTVWLLQVYPGPGCERLVVGRVVP